MELIQDLAISERRDIDIGLEFLIFLGCHPRYSAVYKYRVLRDKSSKVSLNSIICKEEVYFLELDDGSFFIKSASTNFIK